MPDPNSERIGKRIRQHVRVEVRLGVRYIIEADPSRTVHEALTKNISRGGVCLLAQQGSDQLVAAAAGSRPRLRLSLYTGAGDGPADAQAQTAWISCTIGWLMTPSRPEIPAIAGLAFEDLAAEDAEKIDLFVEQCLFRDRESVQEQEHRILSQIKA